jgi:hypothetical protein
VPELVLGGSFDIWHSDGQNLVMGFNVVEVDNVVQIPALNEELVIVD